MPRCQLGQHDDAALPSGGKPSGTQDCGSCDSAQALRRWRSGEWELIPLHRESCATRRVNGRKASPRQLSEASVEFCRAAGLQVAYVPYSDRSGGVVVDVGEHPS